MKNVETKFACGNFEVTATMNEELQAVLAEREKVRELVLAGVTQVLQRKPASTWEKGAAGYDKRPAEFKRDSIEYSKLHEDAMEGIFNEAVEDYGITVTVTEYVREEKEAKFTVEKKIVDSKEGDEDRLEALAEKVGYEGEELTTENVAFLKAIRDWKREAERKALAELD